MNILLVGCNGLIGSVVHHQLKYLAHGSEHTFKAVDRQQLDITDADQLEIRMDFLQPDVVVNCAAYTAVDKAESDANNSYAVNKDGAANLAKACTSHSAKLVHLSTDYVFDGKKNDAYIEDDLVNPINVYGHSKTQGEQSIREHCSEHLIIRTGWAYAPQGKNFLATISNLIMMKKPLKIVDDQFGSPTAVSDIANTIIQLCLATAKKSDRYGTYHYTGNGATSWYDFAQHINECIKTRTGITTKIEPTPTSGYPTAAARPMNSVLNCSLIKENFGIKTVDWRQATEQAVDEFTSNKIAVNQ